MNPRAGRNVAARLFAGLMNGLLDPTLHVLAIVAYAVVAAG